MMSAGQTPEEILGACLGDLDPRIGDRTSLTFHCRCSRERVEGMLCMLGIQELEALLAQEGRAEVTCRFCGDRYVLGKEEVRALIARLGGATPPVM
jgi:molecular chaperone Hsp33